MDENTKKDLARKLKNAFSIAETRAKRIQEIKEAKAEVNLMKKIIPTSLIIKNTNLKMRSRQKPTA